MLQFMIRVWFAFEIWPSDLSAIVVFTISIIIGTCSVNSGACIILRIAWSSNITLCHFRALMFVHNNFGGQIGAIELTDVEQELLVMVNRELKAYINNLEHIKCVGLFIIII